MIYKQTNAVRIKKNMLQHCSGQTKKLVKNSKLFGSNKIYEKTKLLY